MNLNLRGLATALIMLAAAALPAAVTMDTKVLGRNESSKIVWISLDISNPMSIDARCRLDFTGYDYRGGQGRVDMELPPIPPGGSRTVNIPLPISNTYGGNLREADGSSQHISIPSGNKNTVGVLHVAEIANHLNESRIDDFSIRVMPELVSRYSYSSSAGTTPTISASDRTVAQVTADKLPENWLCYSPLYFVVMSSSQEKLLTAGQRQALNTWVSLGGRLAYYGSTETSEIRKGAGTIYRVSENPIDKNTGLIPTFDRLALMPTGATMNVGMPYVEHRAGGRNGAFILATLFLIIAGPVNYFYFSKRGQIRKLIVTVPLISLVFCGIIGLYFILTQGFQRKGGSMSLTMVDEEGNEAITYARHSLLSGLYPLGGFQFNPQTYLQPNLNSDNIVAPVFNLTRGQALTSGYFQPGIPFNYGTITPYTTRERMLYDADKQTLRNGFELPVKAIALFDGDKYYAGGATGAGGEVKLSPADATDTTVADNESNQGRKTLTTLATLLGKQSLTSDELNALREMAGTLGSTLETTGTVYAALLDGKPKSSDSGIDISDGKNLHILVGILGESKEGGQ